MEIKSVDVLEVINNDGSINQFRKNDVIKIVSIDNNCQIKDYVGRIIFIDTESVEIDLSKKFESRVKDIKYKEIESIKLVDRTSK